MSRLRTRPTRDDTRDKLFGYTQAGLVHPGDTSPLSRLTEKKD